MTWRANGCSEVRDLIVMEQVIDMLPLEVRVFVKERQPALKQQNLLTTIGKRGNHHSEDEWSLIDHKLD